MLVFDKIEPLKALISDSKHSGSIGFVPTMGALHQGHISLIEQSKAENALTVCSIFVNPTQFNDPKDLEKYPRTLEADSKMLIEAGCDVLFVPTVEEIYPKENRPSSFVPRYLNVDLGALASVMEGAHRPGHFNGVVQVVSRLFDIVEPDKAYFGQKDFQQLAVIKSMTKQLNYKIDIIPCPIIREPDGLAMSSRNVRLTAEERKLAPLISKTLGDVKERFLVSGFKFEVNELKKFAEDQIKSCKEMTLEYFEIADADTLLPVINWNDHIGIVACIALKLGQIRLIDNVVLK